MCIQQYYLQTSKTYLNACILTFLLLSAILTVCMFLAIRPPFALVAIPFFIVAISQFNGYIRFRNHSKEAHFKINSTEKIDFFTNPNFLLALAPAPALKILLFHPNGFLTGELKEVEGKFWRWFLPSFFDFYVKKRFGFYNQEGELLALIDVKQKEIAVLDRKGNNVVTFNTHSQIGESLRDRVQYRAEHLSSMYTDIHIHRQKHPVSRLRKGWMPLEWGTNFHVNTPILSFDPQATKNDRLLALAVIIGYFQYDNH
ncbi:hypothetical protein [Bacillus sp. B15-48]|uniref:hypothetical protein n=1 Tax=Bacillus sp. B15-48 TaxID=1548601 RepID=UPI0019401B74|nr:hypothetical protein [Bacillus sp. B15-48]MBM4761990.1 hypothetical protein [Bacillus sp. B15-48]